MAPNFLALATNLENLGARWLLAKKLYFMPWNNNGLAHHHVPCDRLLQKAY